MVPTRLIELIEPPVPESPLLQLSAALKGRGEIR
jgi:hypothetical protein